MADFRRADRVAEAIRAEVATFLREEAKDPRLTGFVTVTGVEASRDLRHANVFVSVMGTDTERAATLEGLASVATHLRSRLGRSLRLSNVFLSASAAQRLAIELATSSVNCSASTILVISSFSFELTFFPL